MLKRKAGRWLMMCVCGLLFLQTPAMVLATPLAITAIDPQVVTVGKPHDVTITYDAPGENTQLYIRPGGPYVKQRITLQEKPVDLAISNDYAYVVGDFDGLEVLRLPTDTPPQRVERIKTGQRYQKISIVQQHAYALTTGRIDIFTLEDPATPQYSGHLTAPGDLQDFAITTDRGALLSRENQLLLLDMQPAGTPQIVKTVKLSFRVHALAIRQGILYLAGGEQGLFAMDIRQPRQAQLIGHYRTSGPVLDVSISNHLALVANGTNGMTVLDISDPAQITWIGSHQQLGQVRAIRVLEDGRAYVINDNHDLLLLDMSNPSMPSLISGITLKEALSASGPGNDTIWLATRRALLQLDIEALPPQISNEGLDAGQGVNYGGERKLTIHDDIAYVADWFSGIHLYDISNPRRPQLLSSFHTAGSPKGIVVRDGVAFVADDDHGLQIIDVHDPKNPRQISSLLTSGLAYTPVLAGDLLYLASHRGGFQIIDIHDVSNPVLIADVDTPGKSWSIQVSGHYAYVADDDPGLLVFDISNPAAPQAVAQFNPGGAAEDVLIDGDIAYVAFFDHGVYILDISEPTRPRELGHVSTPGNARGLERGDRYLYVADWLGGIQVLDIAQPAAAAIVGSYDTAGASWGLRIQDGFAFVADWWGGFVVLDISTPVRPLLAGSYHHNDMVRQISTQGMYAYAAKGIDGLQVFDINNPLNPTWVTGVDTGPVQDIVTVHDFAVLCGDGRRITVVDISNPFQPKVTDRTRIGHDCDWLRGVGDQVFIADRHGDISLLQLTQRRLQTSHFNSGHELADLWVDGNDIYLLTREGEILLFRDMPGDTPLAVLRLPGNAAPMNLRAASRQIAVYQAGQGITLLQGRDGKIETTGFIPLVGPVDDMQMQDNRLYAVTRDRMIHEFMIPASGPWHIKTTYQTLNNITRLHLRDNTLYLAGAQHITAIAALPDIPFESASKNRAIATLPGNMPNGAYDVLLTAFSPGQASASRQAISHNGLTIEMPAFGKPRFTMDDLKKIMQQRKAEKSADKPGPD